ncbi:hypothetical protein YC2023_039519 [Brassica napus]
MNSRVIVVSYPIIFPTVNGKSTKFIGPASILRTHLCAIGSRWVGTPRKPSSSSEFPRNIPRKFRGTSVWGFKT